jgi:hypothetical protein
MAIMRQLLDDADKKGNTELKANKEKGNSENKEKKEKENKDEFLPSATQLLAELENSTVLKKLGTDAYDFFIF